MLIDGAGCWISARHGFAAAQGRPALFLDRDNLLVTDPGFLHRAEDVALMPGAGSLVGYANKHAIPAILVTNQSGIARGIFGWDDFHAVNARMHELLAAQCVRLDAILACGWHEEGIGGLAAADHPWRKPRPGMLLAARDQFGVDLSRSWLAGDRASDVAAARAGGLAGAMLISASADLADDPDFAVIRAPDIPAILPELDSIFDYATIGGTQDAD